MERFSTVDAPAMPMRQANIDTDQIIPARFLKKPRELGMGAFLFHDLRFDDRGAKRSEFILNAPAFDRARVLVSGRNFGCGSSRETAVYALMDYGFRAVIASSFGDIFFNNALINGLLPIVLAPDQVDALLLALEAELGAHVRVELDRQLIHTPNGECVPFEVDPFRKRCLLEGVDEIGFTRAFEPQVLAFESEMARERPWL